MENNKENLEFFWSGHSKGIQVGWDIGYDAAVKVCEIIFTNNESEKIHKIRDLIRKDFTNE